MPDRRRPRVPYALMAAVFAPGIVAYFFLLRNLEGFRFAHPFALGLVPIAIGLILYVALFKARERVGVMRHARAGELARLPRGWGAKLAALPLVLRIGVVVLLGIVLARPQSSRMEDEIELEGIDIVVVLDVSGSMEEVDLMPNRLEAAKAVIRDFVQRRRADRLGLVVFGRDAYTYVPLTLDHGTYLRMLADLRIGIIDGRGTAIGNGLGVALARLRKSDARSKVIILLTDGDNNAGNISPVHAAEMAQTLGAKIYTILAGTADSADERGAGGQQYPVNPKLLEQIATMTGGSPYLASDTRALQQRFESILNDLEKSRIRDRGVLYAELYPMFLWPAFLTGLLELVLRLTRLRRLP